VTKSDDNRSELALTSLFPPEILPKRLMLVVGVESFDVEEYEEMQSIIGARQWPAFFRDGCWKNRAVVAYMSIEAVAYYFPAYSLASLEEFGMSDVYFHNLLNRPDVLRHVAGWTEHQKDMLVGFLSRMGSDDHTLLDGCSTILRRIGYNVGLVKAI
jgi:hypothetical protein